MLTLLIPGRLSRVPMTGIRRKKLMATGKNPLKKTMDSFWNACLRKETDQHIFANNMHTNNVSRLFYPICAYLHTSFEQLDAFFCSTFERHLINDTLLR